MPEQLAPRVSMPTFGKDLHERLLVDTSEAQPVHMLVGSNRSFIRLSPTAYHLLLWHNDGVSFEEIAKKLGMDSSLPAVADVEKAYLKVAEEIELIESGKRKKRFGFLFELPLLGEGLVQRIARAMTWAFHPACVFVGLTLVFYSFKTFLGSDIHIRINSNQDFLAGYLMLIASSLVHEFGHATACAHYGQPPSAIGFTIYLVYPALYSDVSSAWRLKRWQRVVVDLGGFYFQFLLAAAFAAAYSYWHWEPLRIAVLGVMTSAFLSLNPVFRMDGYWVLADALGVTNLADQPKRIVSLAWNRVRGKNDVVFPWPISVICFLALYTILMFSVWGYLVWRVGPSFIQMATAYPQDFLNLFGNIWAGGLTGPLVYGFAMKTVSLVFIGYMFYQLFLSLRSVVRNLFRKLGAGTNTTHAPS